MVVHGSTYQVSTPVGQAFVTINTNGGNQPLEMFVNVGKAGSDVTAMAEAMGRLISLIFRMHSPIPPMERARKIAGELVGIGGARSMGFGENRIRSLPDAVAKVIDRHFNFYPRFTTILGKPDEHAANGNGNGNGKSHLKTLDDAAGEGAEVAEAPVASQLPLMAPAAPQQRMVTVDLCPQCGEGSLVFEESCKKCYSCGYSEC
jgi:ribonucleoside-diphosphate reductase alpha chain